MIPVLTSDSYRGLSTNLPDLASNGTQPIFVGRLIWPGNSEASDAFMKIYDPRTCGIANEVIGYIINEIRGIAQPKRAAIVLLDEPTLEGTEISTDNYIDEKTGLIACWATTLEQNTTPFKYIRRLSTFTEKQAKAFYQSRFCKELSSVDHVTGNNDRHEGNFLYIDELKYLAIDQGCVGGGMHWHLTWPDTNAKNELVELTHAELRGSSLVSWVADAILEHEKTQAMWSRVKDILRYNLTDLLDASSTETIVEYMDDRVAGPTFATSCRRLI